MSLVAGQGVDIVGVAEVGALTLRLTFSDGHVSLVDSAPFLHRSLNPQTQQFLDRARFKSYVLRDGNLVWGDYDMCFAIEELYGGTVGAVWEPAPARPLAVAESRGQYDVMTRGRNPKLSPRAAR